MVNILNSGKLLNIRPQLALLIGLNEAIFLGQLHFWLERSNHHYDGHTWVYNSVEQWAEQFPFWSKRTVERALASLREQGLIQTTTAYNSWKMDNRLWYTIDYGKLEELSATNHQPPTTSDQIDAFSTDNVTEDVRQDDGTNNDNVASTLYTESTNKEISMKDQTTTKTEDVVADFLDAPDPELVEGSELALTGEENDGTRIRADKSGSESALVRSNPCPEILSQLEVHGLAQPVTLVLALQHPEEYLQEKIAYLEYELDRRPEMNNPAGWLRCAIEQDYTAPPGYHAAQKAAAEKEKWQAIVEENNRQLLIHGEHREHGEAQSDTEIPCLCPENGPFPECSTVSRQAQEPRLRRSPVEGTRTRTDESGEENGTRMGGNTDEEIRVTPFHEVGVALSESKKNPHPCSPVSVSKEITPLTQAWEKGYHEVAEYMSIGGLLETLQQSVLLSFANGHATIGVKCEYALERLQRRGRNILRNALTFGLGDLLREKRVSYELILV